MREMDVNPLRCLLLFELSIEIFSKKLTADYQLPVDVRGILYHQRKQL